ncbi:MAG TPA: 4-alpha-glucanotransferase [Gemmataceae bacterium]|jgi:4-alpha-glucanotransferase
MDLSDVGRPPARSAGILLHPTSLPGPCGIGDLGPAAYSWVDALTRARQSWWQVLPLGPTGYGDSPYQCFSAFAGNPNLISPEILVRDGLLRSADFRGDNWPVDHVEYERVIPYKAALTAKAWDNFQAGAGAALRAPFDLFRNREADWLDDFALFLALKEAHGGGSWFDWPEEFIHREPAALTRARQELSEPIELHRFRQFLFYHQWDALKQYAQERGVRLIGDVPIFVAGDSADVWTNPELFLLDERRRPAVVSGVPPDYFSKTGQLWGNPLYDWEAHRRTGYAWWIARMRAALAQVNLVRLDHFRGFEAYWEVPAGEATAENGRWVKGPGVDLLAALRQALGGLPVIAEDLGVITPEVRDLRLQFDLPGMRILQFAFGGALEKRFQPHRHERNTVVYTGTHDNDTTHGWHEALTADERRFFRGYAPSTDGDVSWDLIRLAWMSVADYAITPLQDVLSLNSKARMNRPGQPSGNWRWRYRSDMLADRLLDRLARFTEMYERAPD